MELSGHEGEIGFRSYSAGQESKGIIYDLRHAFFVFMALSLFGLLSAAPKETFRNSSGNYNFRNYSVNNGLSQNMIMAIHQDRYGLMWIGTKEGLNLFDGYTFRIFKYDPDNPYSLSDSHITFIYEDSYSRLWVGTLSGGLHYFDRKTERFYSVSIDPGYDGSITRDYVTAIVKDNDGTLWVGTRRGKLNRLVFNSMNADTISGIPELVRYDTPGNGFSENNTVIQTLFVGRLNQLWIGTESNVINYDIDSNTFNNVPCLIPESDTELPGIGTGLNHCGSRFFFEDKSGRLWMGNNLGLFIYDRENGHFDEYLVSGHPLPVKNLISGALHSSHAKEELWISSGERIIVLNPSTGQYNELSHEKHGKGGLSRGLYTSLFADRGGTIWIGSNGYGLSLFDPGSLEFGYASDTLITGEGNIVTSRDLSIRCFYQSPEDENTLWVGSRGLYKVDRMNSTMEHLRFLDSSGRESGIIFSISGDSSGYLWIGTNIGLIRFYTADNSYRVFPSLTAFNGGGIEPGVNYVHLSRGDVWVLTSNTIARLNRQSGRFEHTSYSDQPLGQFKEALFPTLLEDHKGNFWIAAENGLHYFDVAERNISTLKLDQDGFPGVYLKNVSTILRDPHMPERYLWLGTGGSGLIRIDLETGQSENFTERKGLSNNMVYGILEDDNGHIWISSNRGLSKFNIIDRVFTNYALSDGLQSNEFNSGAFYKNLSGEMFFGGINGYNSFLPSEIIHSDFMPAVVFTKFELLSDLSQERDEFLSSIREEGRLNLTYKQNNFTLEFASLDYSNPEKNRFEFSLSTSEVNWNQLGYERSVTFANLNPGNYTLRVRGTNGDGIWSDNEALLFITIEAPWWQQTWVYFGYFLLLASIALGFRKYELSRVRLRNRMKIANFEAVKLRELDHLKSQFFSNISHEFRTPLTLIKGPLEELIEDGNDAQKQKTYKMMHTNASRLLRLINQLLELSRLESGNYKVRAGRGDITGFVKGLAMSFASLAKQKNQRLSVEVSPELDTAFLNDHFYFDPDILEKIINNLLSNAFKFTPEHGSITVMVCQKKTELKSGFLEIIVADTGIGIPADKLKYIYDRFYQVDGSSRREHEGSGVGLAYVKELVRIHNASIIAKSQPGEGTKFSIRLPVGTYHLDPDQIIQAYNPEVSYMESPETDYIGSLGAERFDRENESIDKPWVLIIEDHTDVSNYITESLLGDYRIIQASNAQEGFLLAEENIPDLIISDIMMPGMDGYELCKRIKNSEKTSHIPVILLTARADDSDKITGLDTGADDYITKPFNIRELSARIANLINSRLALREKFSSNSIINPKEIIVTSSDTAFIEKLLGIVESNIENYKFTVEDLGREAGLGYSQLHRKLKALVNMTANQFIRSVRMNRAMELIRQNAGNISEISYMVGYDDPGYFTRSFRNFFGKLPSEVNRI